MLKRANWLIAVLMVALLISVTAVGTLVSDNSEIDRQGSATSTRLQMNSVLSKAHMSAQGEIGRLDGLMKNTSASLGPLGLNGTLVRSELILALASDPYILDIITYDRHGVVVAAEPASYDYLEGMNLSTADNVAQMLGTKMPVMSNVIPPIEGLPGAVIAAPVFDSVGMFIGAVSALFSVSAMMNNTLPQLATGMDFTFWCIQLDGQEIYDTDPAQIGMNLINGSDYQDYPGAQAMGSKVVNETSGYITYSYFVSLSTQKMVEKECFWTTVGAYGIEWRLAIAHHL
ncbi:MAG TPA: hypothetical protein VGK23_11495 [Methanomassiliicoccales archaeon]|jgi:hypothetical protein